MGSKYKRGKEREIQVKERKRKGDPSKRKEEKMGSSIREEMKTMSLTLLTV